jgi:hypothetical protein
MMNSLGATTESVRAFGSRFVRRRLFEKSGETQIDESSSAAPTRLGLTIHSDLTGTGFGMSAGVFVGGQMLDVITTITLLLLGGKEANPAMSLLIESGYIVFALSKLALSAAVLLASYTVYKGSQDHFLVTVIVVVAITYLGVFSNLFVLGFAEAVA